MDEWNDEFFLGYVETHSKTERALFHVTHIRRFLLLAGESVPLSLPSDGFIAMHYENIRSSLEKATRALDDKRMTYAQKAAHEAIDRARRCEFAGSGIHSEACRSAAAAIEEAIRMCAKIAAGHREDVDTMHWRQACERVAKSIGNVIEEKVGAVHEVSMDGKTWHKISTPQNAYPYLWHRIDGIVVKQPGP